MQQECIYVCTRIHVRMSTCTHLITMENYLIPYSWNEIFSHSEKECAITQHHHTDDCQMPVGEAEKPDTK